MVAHKRVLVVDDEDVVCRSYERVLTGLGYEVDMARDGEQALAEARARAYDVLLADLRMPGMDGLQMVRELRTTQPQVPVVVITGYPSQDTLQEAARLGVTDYLTKPVAPDVLAHAAETAITMPRWQDVAPYLAAPPPAPAGPPAAALATPATAPAIAPTAAAAAAAAPTAPGAIAPVRPPGLLWTTLRLVGGLCTSVVYVVFLPLAGFVVLLGLGGKALVRRLVAKEA